MEIKKKSGLPPHWSEGAFFKVRFLQIQAEKFSVYCYLLCRKIALLWSKKILNVCNFSYKWNGNVARIVFCHCGYEGCYVLNKIKVLISSSERAIFLK
jgi:hypothetical protein